VVADGVGTRCVVRADPLLAVKHGVRLVAHRAAVLEEHADVALAQPVGAQLARVEAEVARVEDEPGAGPVVARVDQRVEQAVGALLVMPS
jgi:hypothetical protein